MEHNCQKILFNHFCCVMIAFLFNYGILFYAKYIRERHYHYTHPSIATNTNNNISKANINVFDICKRAFGVDGRGRRRD